MTIIVFTCIQYGYQTALVCKSTVSSVLVIYDAAMNVQYLLFKTTMDLANQQRQVL